MSPARSKHLAPVDPERMTQERIASSIVSLLDISGMSHSELAAQVEMDPTKLSKSLGLSRRLTLAELESIAGVFKTPITLLFEGGDEIRRRAWAAAVGECPPWDSNPEPAD